jgi:DNA-binding MarR family transcriptional regulator
MDDTLTAPADRAAAEADAAQPFVEQLLPYLLARASHLVSAAFYARLRRRGISVRRWRLLAMLWDGGGMTIGALSRSILIEQSSTTRLVDRAVADGLVDKRADARDRRRVRVHITPAGRDYIADLIEDAAQVDRAIAAEVDPQATTELKATLRTLIARFHEQ